MCKAGLAKMHLRVDDTGKDMEAGAILDALGRVGSKIADGDDAAALHADIGTVLAVLDEHGPVLEDRIVLGHVWFPACVWAV